MDKKIFTGYPKHVRERFRKFHYNNPEVAELFFQKAKQMRRTGRRKYSAMRIMQSIRWDHDLKTTGDVFKINNDFVPIYARFFMYENPEYADFFETRAVISKGVFSTEHQRRKAREAREKNGQGRLL